MKVKEKLNLHKDEILAYVDNNYTQKQITEIYNVSTGSISAFLRNIYPRLNCFEKDKDDIIKDYSLGMTIASLATKYHHTEKDISKLLRSNGVEIRKSNVLNRKYTLDQHYFDKIDTQEKAYILGLLYADGCIVPSKHFVTISLQESDVDVLKKINDELKSSRPLGYRDYSQKSKKYSNQYVLCINSIPICENLVSMGLVENKDFRLEFPTNDIINDEFMASFLLGMSDGDGSIITKECRFSLTGNEEFIIGMKEYIERKLNIHCTISLCHNKESKTRNLRISGRNQVKKYLDYI